MRDQQALDIFKAHIDFLNETSPREFRVRLLGLYETTFGITHSASCSLYNKIKKSAVASGIIPEIGRSNTIVVKTHDTVIESATSESFNKFLVSLELRISEKDSWAICDESGNIVDHADSGLAAQQKAKGNKFYRLEPL